MPTTLHNLCQIVRIFEEEIFKLMAKPYSISVYSCANAMFLICKNIVVKEFTIASKTYLSVPESIIHGGGEVVFDKKRRENNWSGNNMTLLI